MDSTAIEMISVVAFVMVGGLTIIQLTKGAAEKKQKEIEKKK